MESHRQISVDGHSDRIQSTFAMAFCLHKRIRFQCEHEGGMREAGQYRRIGLPQLEDHSPELAAGSKSALRVRRCYVHIAQSELVTGRRFSILMIIEDHHQIEKTNLLFCEPAFRVSAKMVVDSLEEALVSGPVETEIILSPALLRLQLSVMDWSIALSAPVRIARSAELRAILDNLKARQTTCSAFSSLRYSSLQEASVSLSFSAQNNARLAPMMRQTDQARGRYGDDNESREWSGE